MEEFIKAAKMGDVGLVRQFIKEGADVNAVDENGWPALMVAAKEGHTDTVRLLLEAGADVNAAGKGGATALMWVVDAETDFLDHNLIRMLLAAGADINQKDEDGMTALNWLESVHGTLAYNTECLNDTEDKYNELHMKAINAINLLLEYGATHGITDERVIREWREFRGDI